MPWTTVRPHDVVAVIMGGGAGTRLFPLTKDRAKPAVPLAGKYRLVDIPISNCLNSELRRIFLLTQFNSGSLHRHIQESYRFDNFSPGFVEILAAEQRPNSTDWYQGTADAVRQNLVHMESYGHRLVLILSGDQLYRMNYCAVIEQHVASGAEVTVATTPVHADIAGGFGIMEVAEGGRITRFVEKPTDPAEQATLRGYPNELPASMGIYVFDREVLAVALAGSEVDFGKHIIPRLIETRRVHAFRHDGYWEDIGTILAFYEANLDLCEPLPKFNFYDAGAPIFTHARYLPATKIIKSTIERSVIADGCIINDAHDRALTPRRAQPGPGRRHHPGLPGDGAGLLRQPGAGADPGCPDHGDRPRCLDRADDRRQERPDRRRRADLSRGEAGLSRRSQLLHPRRDRDHPQECDNPERHRDLSVSHYQWFLARRQSRCRR